MDKLICNHCKNELTVENIKNITFGRIYETTEFGIRDREVAFVWCNNCGESSIIEEHIGYELELDLEKTKKYTFKEVEYLLKNLSNIDKEKVRDCKFRISESYPDDDSGDVYYYITILKDDTEIGKINMYCNSNTYFDLIDMETKTTDDTPYYTYEMTLYEDSKEESKDIKTYFYSNRNKDKVYSFNELSDLLEHISDEDRIKVSGCQFKVFEQSPDDDSGDVYYYITIYKDNKEIGKINMISYLTNTGFDMSPQELLDSEEKYTYTMELNKEQSSNEKDYIECPKCHNKILGKYWLNVKYQGHDNYGDYEEDIYTGECPICGEKIETSELELYTNSLEAEEIELQQYYKIIGNFGYSSFPFDDCEYSETCAADELKYIKNALGNLTDILNVKYLYNIYNLQAIQSNRTYDYSSEVIVNIVHNTSYADFNIDSIKDCQFRLLDCSALNDIVEDDIFDTPTITLLLQLIRNNKIIGYIEVSQQYPLDMKFAMFKVTKDSNKKLEELCKFYTNMYESIEDTPIMLSKSIKDFFNTPVCKKCGQLFCDCDLRCPICGKVFCEHKYKW